MALLGTAPARAQEPAGPPEPEAAPTKAPETPSSPAVADTSGVDTGWTFGPSGQVYPEYAADPRRPQMAFGVVFMTESDVEALYGNGMHRIENRIGERIPILRYTPASGRAWELSVEGGFFGQFDLYKSLENIGWDGWYGLNLAWSFAPGWAGKFHYRHLSSHLGDEFIERTDLQRINYTREDLTLGLAWTFAPGATVYAEGGIDVHKGAERQENLFFQAGAQFREPERTILNAFGWQVATDVQMFQEEDYQPDLSLQAALLIPAQRFGQFGRIALEFHTGRALIGELSALEESYIALFLGWEF